MSSYNAVFDVKESTMRTTVNLDDELLTSAKEYSGEEKVSAVVNLALKEYVQHQAARRLAALGGTMKEGDIIAPPRRRFE